MCVGARNEKHRRGVAMARKPRFISGCRGSGKANRWAHQGFSRGAGKAAAVCRGRSAPMLRLLPIQLPQNATPRNTN